MQLSIFDTLYPQFKIENPIRLIELFAGYGSQAMALERLGVPFEHYRVVEFDKYAIASYNAIHGTNFPPMDICKTTADDLAIVDTYIHTYILTYSFPCTDISQAGLLLGMAENSNTRSSLLWQVKRLLAETKEKPQVLLMENVPNIQSDANLPHLQKWISFLNSLGYKSYYKVLNSCDFGVAQHRERFFCISILGDYSYVFPETMDLRYCARDYFENLTEEQALQQVVKQPKAYDLLVKLNEKGQL